MSATVAIVLRTSARPLLLRRALASVRAQTHDAWRLVVVVDGGDPAEVTEALAAAGLAEDERVTVLTDGTGRGPAGAGNAGLAVADGDFVVLHDDDDTWAPGFLAETVAHLEANPDQVAVAARTDAVTESVSAHGIKETGREPLAPGFDRISLLSVARGHVVPAISLVVRREAQREVGELDTSLPVLDDWDFLLRLLAHGPVGYLADEPLAAWHRRPEATGPDANSVLARPGLHREVADRLRERYLRGDLSSSADRVGGLGLPLVLVRQLDEHHEVLTTALADQADQAAERADHHREHLDLLSNSQREHVDVMTTELQLEIGRLRGELMVMRELVSDLTEQVESHQEDVESALERTTRTIEVTMNALRAAAQEPDRPVRESFGGLPRKVKGVWRRKEQARPAVEVEPDAG
jgi:GT2 family glycosyltransferase